MCWILPNGGADEDPEPALEHATSVAKTVKPAQQAAVEQGSAIFPRMTVCLSLLAKTVLPTCLGATSRITYPKCIRCCSVTDFCDTHLGHTWLPPPANR